MRVLVLLTLLLLPGCVGYVEYDPTAAQECERTSVTILFPTRATETACP